MSDLDYKLFRKMVKTVASQVSRSFPSYVSAQDTESHLWLYLYERRELIRKTVEDEPEKWEFMISSTLRKEAFSFCVTEKAAAEGKDPRDTYSYSLPKITQLLEVVFEYEDWQSFAMNSDGQPRARGQANMTGDRIAELADVKAALERLPDNPYNALLWTYKYHLSNAELGVELDISEDAAKKRVQRARESLQRELGRRDTAEEPSPSDRRTVRSNAAARAYQSNLYEG